MITFLFFVFATLVAFLLLCAFAQNIVPAKAADVVPSSIRSLAVIAEPRLDPASGAVPWFLVASPAAIDTIEYAYTRMPFASASLGAQQPLLASELLGYGRDPSAPVKDAVTADGDVVVPIDAEAFGFWLKAAFGAPTTSGAGPYTHEFRSGGWTLPSMSIETALPEVPRYAMYSGCVLDQLSWQMQRSGLLTATAKLVAQGEAVATTSAAGTPAQPALKRFGHFNGSITRNGAELGNVVSAEITYANNLDRIETIRSDGRIDGADPSIAALTGRVEVRFADSTLVNQAIAGDPCELEFAYTLPSGESFTLTVQAVYLPRPRIEIAGPQGVQATFDWQAARDAGVGRMCTATHSRERMIVMTPPRNDAAVRLSDHELEAMLARAAEEGARRALSDVGLGGKDAQLTIHDMRSLLECIQFVRRTAVQTAVHVITTGALIALLTGIAMKMRWFGPNP